MELSEILRFLSLGDSRPSGDGTPVVEKKTIEGVAEAIREGKCKNIIVMTGAGISVAAGIPDFRSPGTGLYSQLGRYNLPRPESIFEIDFFKANPKPFCLLAKELYPGKFTPTHTHFFINLLNQKGVLLRNYTQNIDTLERIAGVPAEKLVEAHGSFGTSHCIKCEEEYTLEFVRDAVFKDEIPTCSKCGGLVKPDIVFFGEGLPSRFFDLQKEDFAKCDLLIVIGTSLAVYPFASLVSKASRSTSRVLINREDVGDFNWSGPTDVFLQANDCQEAIKQLVELIGWKGDLEKMIKDHAVKKDAELKIEAELEKEKDEKKEESKQEAKESKKEEEEGKQQTAEPTEPKL
eukprot:TRINITY_DN7822_c0_g1_i1.p1 TRINITY_DN7822_c0_g1~~TRINITY_DN7822_c0_g1_i1.p1  ORF type:complete len:348 (-),score=116.46 TRINITY_DN7822_c0_g1_i1:56-1099(-)